MSEIIYSLTVLAIGLAGAFGLQQYLNLHPRKSLIREVEKYENLYIQEHGALPPAFPERPKTHDELVDRLRTLRYITKSSEN